MCRMQGLHIYWSFLWSVLSFSQVNAMYYLTLSHDGPVVLGGTITFRADLYSGNNERPSGNFRYKWTDDALTPHVYESPDTSNTTMYWTINYPRDSNNVGMYEVHLAVSKMMVLFRIDVTSLRTNFYITPFLNGNITMAQSNKTLQDSYVSSATEAKVMVNMRKGDYDFITSNATSISTYWFIDCKYYGQTNDFTFLYNFTIPNESHTIEALVIASFESPTTTTTLPPPWPITIATTTTTTPNTTTSNTTVISTTGVSTTLPTTTMSTTMTTEKLVAANTTAAATTEPMAKATSTVPGNISLPYICSNSSIIPPDPNKIYGHFVQKVNVRAPIMNITVEGTNWIQPWDMLSLNVTCNGSGPFHKCLQYHRGKYNVTGNETCDNGDYISSCNFSIIHYFLEPSVYTILVIMNNNVSKQVYPLVINIYKVTTKPQLSVIVVPVSCTLAAVVLIVFGVAYYIQSRARFTVEVADFDFGQNNPEIEYKTFGERLRDSFNNALSPGSNRISGYQPLSNPQALQ